MMWRSQGHALRRDAWWANVEISRPWCAGGFFETAILNGKSCRIKHHLKADKFVSWMFRVSIKFMVSFSIVDSIDINKLVQYHDIHRQCCQIRKRLNTCKAHDTVRLDLETGKAIWISDDEMMCWWCIFVELIYIFMSKWGLLWLVDIVVYSWLFALVTPRTRLWTMWNWSWAIWWWSAVVTTLVVWVPSRSVSHTRDPSRLSISRCWMLGGDGATYRCFMVFLRFRLDFVFLTNHFKEVKWCWHYPCLVQLHWSSFNKNMMFAACI